MTHDDTDEMAWPGVNALWARPGHVENPPGPVRGPGRALNRRAGSARCTSLTAAEMGLARHGPALTSCRPGPYM